MTDSHGTKRHRYAHGFCQECGVSEDLGGVVCPGGAVTPFDTDSEVFPAVDRSHVPDCQKCGNNTNVVGDYGWAFEHQKEPKTMPWVCLGCGEQWGGE